MMVLLKKLFLFFIKLRRAFVKTPKVIYKNEGLEQTLEEPTSQLCSSNQIDSRIYKGWMSEMAREPRMHRKEWEWVYILQVLKLRGMLKPGKVGLGFGCGQEPIPLVIAKYGAEVIITDSDPEAAAQAGWIESNEFSSNLQAVYEANNKVEISKADFLKLATFRNVDMNNIHIDGLYDFIWSSCAFEHLGSVANGQRFVEESTKLLKPGGVAVHTTEFNLTSNEYTFESEILSFFTKRNLEEIGERVSKLGARMMPLNTNVGGSVYDDYIDLPPYKQKTHLKLGFGDYAITSVGIIIEK